MKLRHTLLMAAFIFLAESKGGFFDKEKKWGTPVVAGSSVTAVSSFEDKWGDSPVAEESSVTAVSSFEDDEEMGEGLVQF